MCGIAAIIAPEAQEFRPRMEAMLDRLGPRGPDGRGIWSDGRCMLGHVRLSVIDIDGGAQPMSGLGGTVSFNGELYGFWETRKEYDYPFRTRSDTELLLASYARHGVGMCRSLQGMFAFALWDGEKLICGRDRFGEKPLYYAIGDKGEFIIASTPGAILASGLVTSHVDMDALSAWLRMGWIPEGMSIFEEIRQLCPGHTLVYQNGKLVTRRYWNLPALQSAPPLLDEAAEEFRRLLDKAVDRCLTSDVETGLLLSGGLDSTTIAAVASGKVKIRSFAFGMAGARNELHYAEAAAVRYGLPMEKTLVSDIDFAGLMMKLPEIYDEPLADTSCLPTVMLCQHVASRVKVVIGGDGGDELLGGYAWYRGLNGAAEKVGKVSNGWTSHASAHFQRRSLCDSVMLREAGLSPWYPELPAFMGDSVDDAMRMDLAGFLPSDILKKTDRASMFCGLELRSPFLDTDLASFLISLPPAMKIAETGKLLMRKAYGDDWPEAVRNRPKQGFGMDTKMILARDDMRELVERWLDSDDLPVYGLLPADWFRRYAARRDSFSWNLLVLSIWCGHAERRGWIR